MTKHVDGKWCLTRQEGRARLCLCSREIPQHQSQPRSALLDVRNKIGPAQGCPDWRDVCLREIRRAMGHSNACQLDHGATYIHGLRQGQNEQARITPMPDTLKFLSLCVD